MSMSITAVILTKNEERNIEECIKGLSWCNEILVIDDNSTDRTVGLAQKMKVTVLERSLNGNFSSQRNFALEKAKGDWVLFVDADERVSPSLAYEIQGKIAENVESIQGYFIKRSDTMWGKELKHGETGQIQFLRLGKKDAGSWIGRVHEIWEIQGKTARLKNSLSHLPHPNLTEFLGEINFYTTLRAQELFDKNTKALWWHIIVYPKAKFFVTFFLKQGYRDGIPGLLMAILMSLHSFLVRGKLWLLYNSK